MPNQLPRSPFATRLSGSAKETELRIRNIFQWKKKRPPVILIVLSALTVLLCGNLVSCQPGWEEPGAPEDAAAQSPAGSSILSDGIQEPPPEPSAQTAPKVGVYIDPEPNHYDPMGSLTQEQKDLLSDLPVGELPRQAADLGQARRGQFWRDTLIPLAYNEPYDVTLYGVVSADSLRGLKDPLTVSDIPVDSDGIVLRAGDRAVYVPLPWYDNAYWGVNPWMEIADFDGDGQAEAAVCTHWGRGAGLSVEALCLFELDTLAHSVPDYSTLDIDVTYDPGSHTAVLSANGHAVTVEVDPQLEPLKEVSCGSVVNFSCEDGRLFCHISLDFSGDTRSYLAKASAPIVWDGDGYSLGPVTALSAFDA